MGGFLATAAAALYNSLGICGCRYPGLGRLNLLSNAGWMLDGLGDGVLITGERRNPSIPHFDSLLGEGGKKDFIAAALFSKLMAFEYKP